MNYVLNRDPCEPTSQVMDDVEEVGRVVLRLMEKHEASVVVDILAAVVANQIYLRADRDLMKAREMARWFTVMMSKDIGASFAANLPTLNSNGTSRLN